jgi:AcrR family transcriptional regulator
VTRALDWADHVPVLFPGPFMTPRPYTPVERQKSVDAGRERILAAARALLEVDDAEQFSLDAVARRAGVSRMTIYNQFESKPKLLEALFDSFAARGPIAQMGDVFAEPDARAALDAFIAVFGRFWTYSRRAHGRLRAAASDDADLAAAMESRNERRRGALTVLVKRLAPHISPVVPRAEVVNILYVLLSFETFDAIAGPSRSPNDVVPIIRRMVHAVLGLKPAKARRPS